MHRTPLNHLRRMVVFLLYHNFAGMEVIVLDESLCQEKHRRVDERLTGHDAILGIHDEKIDRLDRSDATNSQSIVNICQQIGSLTKAIWGLVSAILLTLTGFFIWYVQGGGQP